MGAWGFNEAGGTTAADASGNGNTATLVNGPSPVAGQHGNAVNLDGVNDQLQVPNSPSLDVSGNALTLSLWLRPASIPADSVILGKFWAATMSSPFYQYGLELQSGGAIPVFEIGTPGGLVETSMGSRLTLNQWSHLAVVFGGGQARFYVNGQLVTTKPVAASITARGNLLRLGADANTQQFYKGAMDDLRVYNRALTALEVQADMNTGL